MLGFNAKKGRNKDEWWNDDLKRRELIPVRIAVVKDENGNTYNTLELQQKRWRRHFTKILNLQSEYSL